MPNLRRLVERGVIANLASLHPVLSPMLWTSIATGKRPYKHGVLGFAEPIPDGTAVRPVSSLSRKTKAIWNILQQNGLRSNVVGWWPSHPAEPIDGVMVSNLFHQAVGPLEQPWPMPRGAVHPDRLEDTLAGLRFHPSELVEEQVLPFVPRAAEIDQDTDRRLSAVMRILAECTSVHAAATWLMEHEPWDFMAVYYDAIDHFCHGFMKYHPPRSRFVPEKDYELFQGVVEAGYRFHDMMLGALLRGAGEDTTLILVSDHGFHADHSRAAIIPDVPAGPAHEHRDFGVFLAAGPGMQADALIHGASLLDVTPTILTLFGLPVGDDMDGRPLLQAFESAPETPSVPSWDTVEGEAGMHTPDERIDPIASREALEQLVELGYIERLPANREQAAARTARELRFNLALSYMDADLHMDAVPILRALVDAAPDQHRFGLRLAMCFRALGWSRSLRTLVDTIHERRRDQAEEARRELVEADAEIEKRRNEARARGEDADDIASLLDDEEKRELLRLRQLASVPSYDVDFLRGWVAAAEGEHEAAISHLQRAEAAEPLRPGLHIQIGESYLALRRWPEAERTFCKALEIDAENPHAQLGLARCYLRTRRPERAAEAAIAAVSLLYGYPMAHFCLGQALAKMQEYPQAAQALEVATTLNPNFKEAHQHLARIYARLGETTKAAEQRRLARAIRPRTEPTRVFDVEPTAPASQTGAAPGPETHLSVMGSDDAATHPFITVVTGLPRSGTSMLMQMLAAGGLSLVVDGERPPDADNPRGYFEHAAAARLRERNDWLAEAVDKGVKIVAQLVPYLPGAHGYRVIFIERDLDEVLASQDVMLERLERRAGERDPATLRRIFEQHLVQVKAWLSRQPNIQTLFVRYRGVLDDPLETSRTLDRFLGGGLAVEPMAAAVDPSLYRQRGAPEEEAPGDD
jgi:predicted AlkP superfamily phosphohydrolase/phosphomutase/predicted Zn-dependent protease